MSAKKIQSAIFVLLPSTLFLVLCWALPFFLTRYSNIGPVRDGQPLFLGHYTSVLNSAMLGLIILGFLTSVLVLSRSWKSGGLERYVLSVIVVSMIPIQYIVWIATSVELWGK
jgi:hypothetical protein